MSEVERPRCDKCRLLMAKNGMVKRKNGVTYRFRCTICGSSKVVTVKQVES